MNESSSREAWVWTTRYRESFSRWALSAYADTDALDDATLSLRSLLERCPDRAADVERIASVACFSSRRMDARRSIAKLAQCGLEADSMAPEEQRPRHAPAILLLSLAEAELHAQRRPAGLDALHRLEQRLDKAPSDDAFSHWVQSRMRLLLADLHELAREEQQARDAYAVALSEVTPLLADEASRNAFLQAWAAAMSEQPDGPPLSGPQRQSLDEIALMELRTLASSSALGAARSVTAAGSMMERAAAARTALKTLEAYGIPPDLSPFELTAAIGSLPPDEAEAFGNALAAKIEQQREYLENGELPPGITNPDVVAMVRRGRQRQADLLKRQRVAFDVAARVAIAEAHRAAGNTAESEKAGLAAIRLAMESRLGGPQVTALGNAFAARAERDRASAQPLMKAFLIALAGTIEVDPEFLAEPRIRAQFDRPLAIATAMLLEQLGDGGNAPARRQVSALLDLLRRPEMPPPGILAVNLKSPGKGAADDESGVGIPTRPLLAAADSIGRIRAALRARESTIAVVSHVLGTQVAFLLIRGDENPLQYFVADAAYSSASAALERAAYVALRASGENRKRAEDVLADAGRRAFEAMPTDLQHAIRNHRTIMLAPDFRSRQDTVPFELMKDGEAWLGVNKVFARSPSLAQLATSLDTRVRTASRWRALVTAAPVTEGYDALDLAPREQQEIVETMSALGFDAPMIDPARLSAQFFTDRLAYVDVLHVTSHGESGADLEWLVLPGGQRLVVDDLLQNPQYRMPFVYLNTCNLGQTRYLGAGVSRGLAHTFAELGAPAVIAHTKPVSDESALRLASAFYAAIPDHDVGEALLEARRALLADGDLAAWASAVLIGDPGHSLVAARSQSVTDLASDLLDAYFSLNGDDTVKAAVWVTANAELVRHENPRVEAAVGLVLTMSQLQNLESDEGMAVVNEAVAVADALHHLPARAMLRVVLAGHADQQGTSPNAEALLEDAVRYLAPLAAFEPQWGTMLGNVRGKLARQRSSARGIEIQSHVPPGQDDDGQMRAVMEALMGAQQAAEERYGRVTVRDAETNADDIAWNAVVMGHPNRFEDIPESVKFAAQVARKFARQGSLPENAMKHAPAMLAGMLRYLWDSQNLNYLARDAAEVQAGALTAMLDDIRAHWAPPDKQAWYSIVEQVPTMVDELLAFIDGLKWEEIYVHLDKRMDALAKDLQAILAEIQATHPTALGGCAAFVCGVVMEKNTFSPLDGSVPESIGERLTRVYHTLARDNQTHFFAYDTRGHEMLATREVDELDRWKMEPEGGHPTKRKKTSKKKTGGSKRKGRPG